VLDEHVVMAFTNVLVVVTGVYYGLRLGWHREGLVCLALAGAAVGGVLYHGLSVHPPWIQALLTGPMAILACWGVLERVCRPRVKTPPKTLVLALTLSGLALAAAMAMGVLSYSFLWIVVPSTALLLLSIGSLCWGGRRCRPYMWIFLLVLTGGLQEQLDYQFWIFTSSDTYHFVVALTIVLLGERLLAERRTQAAAVVACAGPAAT
jgi:hypothetical protein